MPMNKLSAGRNSLALFVKISQNQTEYLSGKFFSDRILAQLTSETKEQGED
jgi:hypothetical protein